MLSAFFPVFYFSVFEPFSTLGTERLFSVLWDRFFRLLDRFFSVFCLGLGVAFRLLSLPRGGARFDNSVRPNLP